MPSTAKILREQINSRLPKVSLVEMIQEVDAWINYSKELLEWKCLNSFSGSTGMAGLYSESAVANGDWESLKRLKNSKKSWQQVYFIKKVKTYGRTHSIYLNTVNF